MTGRPVKDPYRRHPILESCFAGHPTVAYKPRKSVAPERFKALVERRQQARGQPQKIAVGSRSTSASNSSILAVGDTRS
jgi:hypothetical protein